MTTTPDSPVDGKPANAQKPAPNNKFILVAIVAMLIVIAGLLFYSGQQSRLEKIENERNTKLLTEFESGALKLDEFIQQTTSINDLLGIFEAESARTTRRSDLSVRLDSLQRRQKIADQLQQFELPEDDQNRFNYQKLRLHIEQAMIAQKYDIEVENTANTRAAIDSALAGSSLENRKIAQATDLIASIRSNLKSPQKSGWNSSVAAQILRYATENKNNEEIASFLYDYLGELWEIKGLPTCGPLVSAYIDGFSGSTVESIKQKTERLKGILLHRKNFNEKPAGKNEKTGL